MRPFRRRKVNRRLAAARPPRRLPLRGMAVAAAVAAAAGAASWGAVQLANPAVMPVKYVRISGALQHLDAAALRDAVKESLKGNFITADTAAVRQRIAAMPWVKAVAVGRVWPDTLTVAVVERRAVGRWGGGGLVSAEGELFRPEGKPDPALPLLDGPGEDAPAVVDALAKASAALRPLRLSVAAMSVNGRHAWRLNLDNGISVVLGRDDFDLRLARLVRVYAAVLAPRADRVQEVDLRYSNGFAVHWRGAPSA